MATYNKKNIEDIDVAGKTVLVRCDFNVPMKDGVITSDKRIVSALPTIQYLLGKGAKVILCSHMGKPHAILTEGFGLTKKEKKAVEALPAEEQAAATADYLAKALVSDKKKLTLKPVCVRLNELLGEGTVTFAEDIIGADAKAKVAALEAGKAVLEKNCLAGLKSRNLSLCIRTDDVLCEGYSTLAEKLVKSCAYRLKSKLFLICNESLCKVLCSCCCLLLLGKSVNSLLLLLGKTKALGKDCVRLTHVRAKNNLCALLEKILDGRKRTDNSLIRGDNTINHRNVEVATNKHGLAGYVDVFNVFLIISCHFLFSP